MNDLLIQQEAIDRAGKLLAITPTGLVPATYTASELADLEQLVAYLGQAARFCRIDIAIAEIERVNAQYQRGKMTYAERSNFIQINNERLASMFGVKPGSLESEASTMKRWPQAQRVQGATVEHYRTIPAGMPQDHARQLLEDAVEGGWTTTKLRLACEGTKDQVVIDQPPSPLRRAYTDMDWAKAEQFCHYHEISSMRRETPTQVIFHSNGSGVLILESDTPIRYTVREHNQNKESTP